jgi:hypothetical protein
LVSSGEERSKAIVQFRAATLPESNRPKSSS